ncbi:MAG: flavin-containing monooxygenase [Acidimicrobiales bacterium]|jgi:cation diffusion facilitator CzcD-associated flavoprotein CzcO
MTDTQVAPTGADAATGAVEHFDVLIVGAGISGIGGAYHLQDQCEGKTFTILETQASFGGTWRTHKYPGIRSDSDLYTFGYRFKPWTGTPIATAAEIRKYMGEVIEENDIARHIKYQHTITNAVWSSSDKQWTIHATRTDTNERVLFTCNFLWMCQGYYRHTGPYTPTWPGMDSFAGPIVHPMEWPEDLDYRGKKVVVIGSGATAATIIPAMAPDCEHITMLQRSPTFFFPGRNVDEMAEELRALEIDETWIHEIVRRRRLKEQGDIAAASEAFPEVVREELYNGIREVMGEDYDLSPHFTPSYRPWQQRIALVPDGDLFHAIKGGSASVVTDHIDSFAEGGIKLKSGEFIEADIIITATGFNMSVLGDVEFDIDGEPLNFGERVTYRGAMFAGIPNMSWVFGYFRASWTLRADLLGDFVCRLLKHMDNKSATVVVPQLRDEDADMVLGPWVDPENFNPGYISRSLHLMPHQGDKDPWRHAQDYWTEKTELPKADLDDGTLRYS